MLSFSATTYAICAYTSAHGWTPNSCNILYGTSYR